MSKKILLIYASLILIGTIAHAETEVIRFASAIYPPFTTLNNATKELEGFDIDLAKALCKKINARCTFTNDQFSNMVISLHTKKYDAWINAITISKERQQEVTFTQPYFATTALLIATQKTSFNAAPVEIKGKTIGVGLPTCYLQLLKKAYGDTIKIKSFATKDDAYEALKNGSIDAVIDDSLVIREWRNTQKDKKNYRLIGLPAKYSKLGWHKYGIAVAKNNSKLVHKLNHALHSIKTKSNGTYNKLVEKYFDY